VNHNKKYSIAYYITAHGYGHGGRSCDIIRAINRLCPQVTIHVVTGLPQSFLWDHIGSRKNPIRNKSFDAGMVQLDSIRVDVAASLDRAEAVYSCYDSLIEEEAAFLKGNAIDAVVCDIPAIPLDAAFRQGIPRIAIGNFSWDWIYSEFVGLDNRWQRVVDGFRDSYAKTDLLLRLPFYGDMSIFPNIEDIPLVASPGKNSRDKIARTTGCSRDAKWILLSFTTLDWNEDALAKVEGISGYEFFTVRPLAWERKNIHALDRELVAFPDVVASMDAVISKPGFGILSDCMVNKKPLIYAERENFLEYPILEAAVQKYLRHVHILTEHLYRGDLQESLDQVGKGPEPQFYLEQGGDCIAVERIVSFLD
jgi:hypothetical protein